MRSCLVEVRHIRIEDALELPLMKDQQVVEAFLPHTPQKAFADRIRSGSVIRSLEHSMPLVAATHTKQDPNLLSLSQSRY
jgi:hypothetical protein